MFFFSPPVPPVSRKENGGVGGGFVFVWGAVAGGGRCGGVGGRAGSWREDWGLTPLWGWHGESAGPKVEELLAKFRKDGLGGGQGGGAVVET